MRFLHQFLLIADLHSDSLLWNRGLAKRSYYDHIDIARLIEGNIDLQVFSVVTNIPKRRNLHSNTDKTSNITPLVIAQRWPIRTRFSLFERAAYQAEKLRRIKNAVPNKFQIVKTRYDLHTYLNCRNNTPEIAAGLLSLEGTHALEDKLDNLNRFFAAGFRTIGFNHFFDNELGGSAHETEKCCLTAFARKVLKHMQELEMFIDAAHASPQLIEDIYSLTYAPRPHYPHRYTSNIPPIAAQFNG